MNYSDAINKLKEGNIKFVKGTSKRETSLDKRIDATRNGQKPYAIVLSCSDSRVIVEDIFNASIGDIFTIEVAGNVVSNEVLGSMLYAINHLGVELVVVLGHTHCGAVEAALDFKKEGKIDWITERIKYGIERVTDPKEASIKNVLNSVEIIELNIKDVKIVGALYDIETGVVEFLN